MELREQILQKAGELFLKYGLRRVTVDDICKALHISKKTHYTVFKGKREMITALLAADLEWHRQRMERSSNADVIEQLFDATQLKKNYQTQKKHINLMYDLKKYYPDMYDYYRSRMMEINRKALIQFLQRGVKQGVFRDDIDTTLTADFLNQWFFHNYQALLEAGYSGNRLNLFFANAVINMLGTDVGKQRYAGGIEAVAAPAVKEKQKTEYL